jgi:iron complex transport system substrate-binding protein
MSRPQRVPLSRALLLCLSALLLCFLAASAAPAAPGRMVVDQLGRVVAVPEKVDRVVCLEHHILDVMLELGAGDRLVGILRTWKADLGPGIVKIAPYLAKLPTPGDLNSATVEEVLKLKPDVVFVTHYAPKDMIDKLSAAGLPVVALGFYKASYEEASKLNPKLKNPDQAYTIGLRDGVEIIGKVLGKEQRAKELLDFTYRNRELVRSRTADVPRINRPTCYMANPDLYTYGTGKYTGVIMDRAGGVNVAESVNGYQKVTGAILQCNPQVIFRATGISPWVKEIRESPLWKGDPRVRQNRSTVTRSS